MRDWLADFVEYASYGEASPRSMKWVGISTVAAVLRRKVWFDQLFFQFTPNFYILVVGAPGVIKKSTSIDIGMNLLKQVPGINIGPSIVTWQALIEHISQLKEEVVLPSDEIFEMSCVTLSISEFGNFFDPLNREFADILTELWDSKIGDITKMTKTSGNNVLTNSWVNMIAATTPKWMTEHFGTSLVGSGLASRIIFLYEDKPTKKIAYPKRHMGDMTAWKEKQKDLVEALTEISKYGGEFVMDEKTYEWGEAWYEQYNVLLDQLPEDSLERDFLVRKQGHLHKLAMVICASRFGFPTITIEDLQEAIALLESLEVDASRVLGSIGQNKISKIIQDTIDILEKKGPIDKRKLFQFKFYREHITYEEYEIAIRNAVKAGCILEQGNLTSPVLTLIKR